LLSVDCWSTTSRLEVVQRYAPEIQRRLRPRLRPTNDSWRVDETYIRVKDKWVYLYRAVDSTGATIDFLLSAKRDAAAAERFLSKALGGENHPAPRVINTDGHAGYPPAIERLKGEGALEENCRHRPVHYLNNVLEQDHRAIKRRVRASQHFRSFWGAWCTIAG
jgi:IS6 family transposase